MAEESRCTEWGSRSSPGHNRLRDAGREAVAMNTVRRPPTHVPFPTDCGAEAGHLEAMDVLPWWNSRADSTGSNRRTPKDW